MCIQKIVEWVKDLFSPKDDYPHKDDYLDVIVSKSPRASLFYIKKKTNTGIPVFDFAVYKGTDNRVLVSNNTRLICDLHRKESDLDNGEDGIIHGKLDDEGVKMYVITTGTTTSSKSAAGMFVRRDHVKVLDILIVDH